MKLYDAVTAALERVHITGLQAAYVFGSFAKGTERPDSDVDIAVLCEQVLDPLVRYDAQERLVGLLRRSVDLVDLRSASTVMQMQVVGSGIVIVEVDTFVRQSFEMLVYASYARLNEERAEILKAIGESGSVYGR